jgi:hypothetical protein
MGYYQRTRSLALSLLYVLPLLAVYEIWLIWKHPQVVNAAGLMARLPVEYLARIIQNLGGAGFFTGSVLFNLVLMATFIIVYFKTESQEGSKLSPFFPVLVESVIYGVLMGHVVVYVMNLIPALPSTRLAMSPLTRDSVTPILLSVGAGVYEELVFRLLLVGGLIFVGQLVFEQRDFFLACALFLGAALVFAAIQQLIIPECARSWPIFVRGFLKTSPFLVVSASAVLLVYCALVWGLTQCKASPGLAIGIVSILLGSLLFALFHHVGPLGEPLALRPFTFRFLAGFILAVIYRLRGFAIAVYTHVAYDILVALSS